MFSSHGCKVHVAC